MGRTDGGTIGQIVGEHMGRRSMALEQTASGCPLTQVQLHAAKAADEWRTETASRATVDKMRMATSPPLKVAHSAFGPMNKSMALPTGRD
jgi:hypothetical protein